MSYSVTMQDIDRILDASYDTVLRTLTAEKVGINFKSVHYMSSRRIIDAVVLNLVLHDKISPTSADDIIKSLRKLDKSLYTTVDSAFASVKENFDAYAKNILGEQFETIEKLNLRAINYIVFVISLDLYNSKRVSGREVINKAYSYAEILDGKIPHC